MQLGNCQTEFPARSSAVSDSAVMDTHINLRALQYDDLVRLGALAAEAIALSQEYDRSRSQKYCKLIAACNVEMLERRRRAARTCGTALS